jgi:endo-1,4-beta-xylanase
MRISGSVILVAAMCCAVAPAQSLRELADKRGIRVGAAVDPGRLSEELYAATLAREFNQVEPENAMKFGSIQPTETGFNYGPADAIVAFAKAHHMAVRGHTLVWHKQNPGWIVRGTFTPEQLSAALQEHIRSLVGHYAGEVYAWDVVNEAFNDDGTLRSTIWRDTPGIGLAGTAYVEQAFRWAHEADPKALLFYNDYSAETVNAKSDAIYKMVQDFRARGVPISGVGLQMHLTARGIALDRLETNIKRIGELGLQVQITEFDMRLPVDAAGVATAEALAKQAEVYRDITTLCLKYPQCTAIQIWGFTDKYSWIPRTYPGTGAGLLFDPGYQAKSSYEAMKTALQAR